MNAGGNTSVQSAAVGTNYATFAAQACTQVTIVNDTGTDVEFRQDAAGVALTVKDGNIFSIFGLTNASQIGVRRKDTSNTQVTVKARWES
jgi:hypothetical protein